MAEAARQLHARIYGRVQLVMFRDFTARTGRSLGLSGTVWNLPDGSVEVFAEGQNSALMQFLLALREGSLLSRVEHVETDWKETTGAYKNFSIEYGDHRT